MIRKIGRVLLRDEPAKRLSEHNRPPNPQRIGQRLHIGRPTGQGPCLGAPEVAQPVATLIRNHDLSNVRKLGQEIPELAAIQTGSTVQPNDRRAVVTGNGVLTEYLDGQADITNAEAHPSSLRSLPAYPHTKCDRHLTPRALPTSATRLTPANKGKARFCGLQNGRYWARTSDLRLVEAALSQLS